MKMRSVDLVLDGDGDVIFVRLDHHSGDEKEGIDVMVPWRTCPTAGTTVVTLRYKYPAKKKA
jgi:hypothetical protein